MRKTINDWGKEYDIVVLDPDGFDRKNPLLMEMLITEEEFLAGVPSSTIMWKKNGKYAKIIRRNLNMNRIIEGTFKVFDITTNRTSTRVILEKDGQQYSIRLNKIKHLIIGKEFVQLRLYKTDNGKWVYWPKSNKIKVFEGGRLIERDKKSVIGQFTPISYSENRNGKRSRIVLQENFIQGRFEVMAHEAFPYLGDLYKKKFFKLTEEIRGGSHLFWVLEPWEAEVGQTDKTEDFGF